jgi:glycosyltransferase involved in cell wall biosynthesis
MKLIINCSTLSGSGVTQVATSFIHECKLFSEHEFHVFLSKTVSDQIVKEEFHSNFKFYEFYSHPLQVRGGLKTIQKLKALEKKINPDVVFSVFGPSWWTPKAPHLIGYAYPHYVYPESPLFKVISFKEKTKISLFKKIHLYFLKRNANYFVSETKDVSDRLQSLITSLPTQNFFIVGNTCNNFFREHTKTNEFKILPVKDFNEFRFLSLCTFHVHKNLDILNKIIPLLNRKSINKKIKFVLTIDEKIFNEKFSDEAKESIINIGRISVRDCPQIYSECDALFLPTLLECFSANYPEAMMMRKPIATSNLTFASTVCGNAALYFDPLDEKDIVKILIKILNDKSVRTELTENGALKMIDFPTAKERAEKYLEICNKIRKS